MYSEDEFLNEVDGEVVAFALEDGTNNFDYNSNDLEVYQLNLTENEKSIIQLSLSIRMLDKEDSIKTLSRLVELGYKLDENQELLNKNIADFKELENLYIKLVLTYKCNTK